MKYLVSTLSVVFLLSSGVAQSEGGKQKESGEKSGTADINIGVGELNESPHPPPQFKVRSSSKSDDDSDDGNSGMTQIDPPNLEIDGGVPDTD